MAKFLYHEKTPVSFNRCLLADAYFAEHWKVIPTVFKVLNRILHFNHVDESTKGGQSEIHWRSLYDRLGRDYAQIIEGLERLGLLRVERSGRGLKGLKNYAYRLTDKCHALLSDSNREYLHKLLTDKPTRRRVQKNISERGYRKMVYGDVRDEIKATVDGITFREEEIDSLLECYTPGKAAFVRSVLIQIEEKSFGDLNYNETDHRVPNPYTLLPARVKTLIQIDGLPYVTTADIRSAYPSLWARWLRSLYPDLAGLEDEKAAYERIFLDPDVDPKDFLAKLLGISRAEIKDVMLSYFNGRGFRKHAFVRKNPKDPFVKFNSWLRSNFPKLYTLWTKMDISQTGNEIGKNFETKLMLDGSVYRKARSLGLRVGYENDGFSIYGNVPKDHPSITDLLDFVTKQSEHLLGIRLVFRPKETPKWNPFDVLTESYKEKADKLCENWAAFLKRFFRVPPEKRNWDELRARKDELIDGLKKCVKVLESIQPKPKTSHPTTTGGTSPQGIVS